jgi:hypothetical protein
VFGAETGATVKTARVRRRKTNGKAERIQGLPGKQRAYIRPRTSDTQRRPPAMGRFTSILTAEVAERSDGLRPLAPSRTTSRDWRSSRHSPTTRTRWPQRVITDALLDESRSESRESSPPRIVPLSEPAPSVAGEPCLSRGALWSSGKSGKAGVGRLQRCAGRIAPAPQPWPHQVEWIGERCWR